MKPKSFSSWFKEQFAGLPNQTKFNKLQIEKDSLLGKLWVIETKMKELEDLRKQYLAAKYSFNAFKK